MAEEKEEEIEVPRWLFTAGAITIFVVVLAVTIWVLPKLFILFGWHPDNWNLGDWTVTYIFIGGLFMGLIAILYSRKEAWEIMWKARKQYRLEHAKEIAKEWTKKIPKVTLKGEKAFATVVQKSSTTIAPKLGEGVQEMLNEAARDAKPVIQMQKIEPPKAETPQPIKPPAPAPTGGAK